MSVIIVGGGIIGATLALAISHLTNGKLPVTIIESVALGDHAHPSYDKRVIALAESTCQQLARINLWTALADCITPITHVHVSDRGHVGFVTITAADYGIDALGNVIELYEMGNRLYQLLRKAQGVTLCCPEKISQIEWRQNEVSIIMSSGTRLNSQLLIAADGSYSYIATSCGIQWRRRYYQQIAVIANVRTQIAHQGWAYERFTQHGPLALLPMLNGYISLVWCHPMQSKTKIESWSDAIFLTKLQQEFGWRLGRFTHVGQRHCYPLILQTACQTVAHRLVLVGNAAQTLHPVAGQGFNLGMRDVMSLAEMLAVAHCKQQDIGSFAMLRCYKKRRLADRYITISITDGLVQLFANNYLPLVFGRNLGMIIIDNLPWLRSLLVERVLGWIRH